MASLEIEQKIQLIEQSKDCPYYKKLCEIGGPGCIGIDWKQCPQYKDHGTMWRRLLIFKRD